MTYVYDEASDEYTFTKSTPTIAGTTSSGIDTSNIVLRQAKESWDTYDETVVPPIWGLVDGAVVEVTSCDASTVTLGTDVPLPLASSSKPEHFDVGHSMLMTLSPVDCANDGTDPITGSSARFYSFGDTTPDWSRCKDL